MRCDLQTVCAWIQTPCIDAYRRPSRGCAIDCNSLTSDVSALTKLQASTMDFGNTDIGRELKLMSCRQAPCPNDMTYSVSLMSDEGMLPAETLCKQLLRSLHCSVHRGKPPAWLHAHAAYKDASCMPS